MPFDIDPQGPPATGLHSAPPGMSSALAEIPQLARQGNPGRVLGVVVLALPASAVLYRLSPEGALRLRKIISEHMAGLLRPKDRIYLIGQWEWLVVLPELLGPAPLTLAAMRLQRAFNGVIETIDGTPVSLRAVCGGARWPEDGDTALHLVQSARIACLQADRLGGDVEFYTPALEQSETSQQQMHQELRHALEGKGNIWLYLQPQVDLGSNRCIGAEALLRWQLANGEWVPPPHTLQLVERFGLRQAFNRWLLQQAMQILQALAEAGIDIVLSLNFSANDLLDVELPDLLIQMLGTWNIAPERLLLEITETGVVDESDQVMNVLQRLRSQGIKLSLDDFGTGYSGMSNLQRLPVQEVKIDQSFVIGALHSKRDWQIVDSIVRLAHSLGISVIAEGVENEDIRRNISEQGCDVGQGHLFSQALPLAAFIAWWQDRARPSS